MTQSEARSKMNLWVQIRWWGIYALLGIITGGILGLITFLFVDITIYVPILIGLGTCVAITYVFGQTIIIQEAHVPPGMVGVILFKGEVVRGDMLSPMKLPVVRRLYVPILGTQEMYNIYTVPDEKRVSPDKIEVTKITTRDTRTTKGVDVLVEVVIRKRVYDPIKWTENHIGATVENDTRYMTNAKAVFTTAVKELIDHFTYDELDESSKCKEEGGTYEGKTFSEALVEIIQKGHGGITCDDCPDNPKYIRVPEWGVDIAEILLESNLATSTDFKNAREAAAVSQVARKTAAQDSQSMLEIARNLRDGRNADGSKINPPLKKNPYKNMSDDDLDTVIQRIMKIRVDPKEFIFHTDGGGADSDSPGKLLEQALVAKILSGDIKIV